MLQRTEELFGVGWSRGFAALIAVSRSGWRESDLQTLLPRAAELFERDRPAEPWAGLRFAGLRRSFRAHLVQRGGQGQWDFFHAQMRLAVGRRSLGDDLLVRRLHTLVADHLESLPADDPQRQGELMFHLIGTDNRLRAARYYASGTPDYSTGGVSGETRALADHVLAGVAEGAAGGSPEANPGLRWVLSLLDLADLESSLAARLADRYQFDLLERLENETGLDTRLGLLIATRACLSRLSAADPAGAGWQRGLSLSHIKIGDVLSAQGNLSAALDAFCASLEIRQRLAASDPGNAGWQRDLAVSHHKLATYAGQRQDQTGLMEHLRECFAVLHRMKQRGLHFDPQMAQVYQQLAPMFSGR